MGEHQKVSTMENLKIVGVIVGILSVGITIGVFSQRLTVVEARVADQQTKIDQFNGIYVHLATIDSNLSQLSKTLLKYDITVEK